MRRDFFLENGIYCKGVYNDFRLYYNDMALTPSCSNIAYITGTLIALKCGKRVYVYKPTIIENNGIYKLYQIAMFETIDSSAYLKVKIYDKLYIIDSNVQIKLCECPKLT